MVSTLFSLPPFDASTEKAMFLCWFCSRLFPITRWKRNHRDTFWWEEYTYISLVKKSSLSAHKYIYGITQWRSTENNLYQTVLLKLIFFLKIQFPQKFGDLYHSCLFLTINSTLERHVNILYVNQVIILNYICYFCMLPKTGLDSWWVSSSKTQPRQRAEERIYDFPQVRNTPGIFSKAVFPCTAKLEIF